MAGTRAHRRRRRTRCTRPACSGSGWSSPISTSPSHERTERGGAVWSEPLTHQIPDGGAVRIVLMSDPDGTAIELVEGDAARLSFVAVTCRDLERSVGFYRALGFRELARFPSTATDGTHLRVDGPVSMVEVLMGAPGRGEVHLMLVGFEQPLVLPGDATASRRTRSACGARHCCSRISTVRSRPCASPRSSSSPIRRRCRWARACPSCVSSASAARPRGHRAHRGTACNVSAVAVALPRCPHEPARPSERRVNCRKVDSKKSSLDTRTASETAFADNRGACTRASVTS